MDIAVEKNFKGMQKIAKTVDQYCSAWNKINIDTRRQILDPIWEQNAKYIDPRSDLTGSEELVQHIEKIQSSRPGATIERTSEVDLHHNIGRFNWHLKLSDGTIPLQGLDIVFFNEDQSKIQKIIGFFGPI